MFCSQVVVMTPEQQRRRRAAHAFADRGWHVQPLVPGSSRPMSCEMCWSESPKYVPHRGVADCPHPLDCCHSFYAATTDHGRIESWFKRFPNANVGIATEASNLIVVDCDSVAHGPITDPDWQLPGVVDGLDVLTVILERCGAPWPDNTLLVWTPRDGMHAYWTRPPGITVRSLGGKFGPSIDVKGSGAFIVAPTSSKAEGGYYRIGDVTDPAPAPKWLLDHLAATGHIVAPVDRARTVRRAPARNLDGGRRYVAKAIELELDAVATCGANRNDQLAKSAFALGQFVGAGLLDQHEVHEALTDAAEHAGISPAERKAQDTIRRGLSAGSHHPRTIPTGAPA
jgi:hypothetical protein